MQGVDALSLTFDPLTCFILIELVHGDAADLKVSVVFLEVAEAHIEFPVLARPVLFQEFLPLACWHILPCFGAVRGEQRRSGGLWCDYQTPNEGRGSKGGNKVASV